MKEIYLIDTKFISRTILSFLIAISMLTSSCTRLFPQITDEEKQETENICNNLKPPSFFIETNRRGSQGRSHMAVFTNQYSSLASPAQVEDYYVNLLTKTGWSYQKQYEPAEEVLVFKKNTYSISVHSPTSSIGQKKVYLVSCLVGFTDAI